MDVSLWKQRVVKGLLFHCPMGVTIRPTKLRGMVKSSDFCGMLRRVLPNAAATAARVLQNILCGLETK